MEILLLSIAFVLALVFLKNKGRRAAALLSAIYLILVPMAFYVHAQNEKVWIVKTKDGEIFKAKNVLTFKGGVSGVRVDTGKKFAATEVIVMEN